MLVATGSKSARFEKTTPGVTRIVTSIWLLSIALHGPLYPVSAVCAFARMPLGKLIPTVTGCKYRNREKFATVCGALHAEYLRLDLAFELPVEKFRGLPEGAQRLRICRRYQSPLKLFDPRRQTSEEVRREGGAFTCR
jgi:hypothetical protein